MPQIEVSFDIDANGIVNVSAKDKATGKEQQIRIQASGGLSDDDIERMVQEAEQHAEEDKTKKELVEARNHADTLVHSTEKNLEEYGDKVSDEDRGVIADALAALKEVQESDDIDELKAKSDTLMEAAMKLGEAMYKASQEDGADGASMDPNDPMAGMGGDMGGDQPESGPADDDATVVDADFEEVDPDKKDN